MAKNFTFFGLITAVIFAGTTAPAIAADPCRDVRFEILNHHYTGERIRIHKVRFKNKHNQGRKQTEVVQNDECPNSGGSTDDSDLCVTNENNLKNANEVDLYDFQVLYRVWEPSSEAFSNKMQISNTFDPFVENCYEDRTYGPIVITGLKESTTTTTDDNTLPDNLVVKGVNTR